MISRRCLRTIGIMAALGILAAAWFPALVHSISQNNQAKIELRVEAKDATGNAIGGARVNVWHDTYGPDTGPPDYQEETDVNGRVVIQVLTGKTAELYIEINRGDLWSRGNVKLAGPTVRHNVVLRKLSNADESDLINVKVHVEEDQEPLAGVRIVFRDRLGSPRIQAEGTTGPTGDATIHVVAWNYRIEATKDGYEPGGSEVYLTTNQQGLTVTAPTIKLKKKTGAEVNVEVVVTVKSATDQSLVNAANIVLTGKRGLTSGIYRGKTVDGVARIPVKEYGKFDLEITQDYYETLNREVSILAGDSQQELPPYLLKEKPKKAEAGDVVNIKVLAGDKNSAPIEGASVTVGKISVRTDASGVATLETTLGFDATYVIVTATAQGYKRQIKSVPVRRGVRYSDAGASATIVLEPGEDPASEDTPIRILVEILDGLTNQPLSKTNVQIRFKGKIVAVEDTGDFGEARIELKDSETFPLSDLRTGLKVDAYHDNYVRRDSDISPDRLTPSREPLSVSLHLERDWTSLDKAIATLEGKVAAWNNDVLLVAGKASSVGKLVKETAAAEMRASMLSDELSVDMAPTEFPTGTMSKISVCRKFAETKQRMVGYENEAAAKVQGVKGLLDRASTAAESCQSPAQANAIKADHLAAIRMAAEFAELVKQVRATNRTLAALAVQFDIAPTDRVLEEKLADIAELSRTANQAAITVEVDERRASALSKGLAGRREALTTEIDALKKAHGIEKFISALPPAIKNRLTDMSALVAGRNSDAFSAPDPNAPAMVKAAAERIQKIKADAESALNNFKRGGCEVATMDDRVRSIEGSLLTASAYLGLHADLPTKASNCMNLSTCKSLVTEIRPLIQQGNVERASAVLARMDALGCDTTGLKAELDTEAEHEYANLLNASKQNCRFQQALELASQIPAGIKARPRVARALADAQDGVQSQRRIEQLIDQADAASDLSAAKSYLAQARQIAAPYPCLTEMLKGSVLTATEGASTVAPIAKIGDGTAQSGAPQKGNDGFWEAIKKATESPKVAAVPDNRPNQTDGPTTESNRPRRSVANPTPVVDETPQEDSVPTERSTPRNNPSQSEPSVRKSRAGDQTRANSTGSTGARPTTGGNRILSDRDICAFIPADLSVERDLWPASRGCKAKTHDQDAARRLIGSLSITIYRHLYAEEAKRYLTNGNGFESTSEFGDGGYVRKGSGMFFLSFTVGPIFVDVSATGSKAARGEEVAHDIAAAIASWVKESR